MNHLDWKDLNYCLMVVREGSVSAAAQKLGVNHTTVSRRITALESQLNVKLFDRSTHGWLLTPIGESILPSIERMEDEAFGLVRAAESDRKELIGRIRVTSLDACIRRMLIPGVNEFSALYPDISIDLLAGQEVLDLSTHDADIAFRFTNNPQPNVVGKKLCDFAFAVYATTDILQRHLDGDTTISAIASNVDPSSTPDWVSKELAHLPIRYRTNSFNVLVDMARQGSGMALMPCSMGDVEPNLRRVPTSYKHPKFSFWILSHIDLRTTTRLRIFRDYMIDNLTPMIPQMEGYGPNGDLTPP